MPVFDEYAYYYDSIYKDKNYKEEALYIHSLINKHKSGCRTLLDIGCGTARHIIELADLGYETTGIDSSQRMLDKAEDNINSHGFSSDKPVLIEGDIRTAIIGRKFDVIISLFHVMSYQITDKDINKSLSFVTRHLEPGGIYIFDFWYGPAVLNQKPRKRISTFRENKNEITRTANPVSHKYEHVVDVNYKLHIKGPGGDKIDEIVETHTMRYYFLSDIKLLLEHHGLKILDVFSWMAYKEPNERDWSACVVAELS